MSNSIQSHHTPKGVVSKPSQYLPNLRKWCRQAAQSKRLSGCHEGKSTYSESVALTYNFKDKVRADNQVQWQWPHNLTVNIIHTTAP